MTSDCTGVCADTSACTKLQIRLLEYKDVFTLTHVFNKVVGGVSNMIILSSHIQMQKNQTLKESCLNVEIFPPALLNFLVLSLF